MCDPSAFRSNQRLETVEGRTKVLWSLKEVWKSGQELRGPYMNRGGTMFVGGIVVGMSEHAYCCILSLVVWY